ncbi:MAG: hypothetical protein Q8Q39_02540 [bacterium]|nr:hypothetical protein [bacterium]
MKTLLRSMLAVIVLATTPMFAQDTANAPDTDTTDAPKPFVRKITMQHFRSIDQRGINVFETPKLDDTVRFEGFKLDFNAAFSQPIQALRHSNEATPVMAGAVNQNELMRMGFGFTGASANLYLNAQLADGIRVMMTSYLSTRHHNETWVKDGYMLIDKLPFRHDLLDFMMAFTTLKVGHFEVNYGDAHYRRSDGGHAMYNPFVENYLLDAFATEVGAEVDLRAAGFLAVAAVTGAEIKGNILKPEDRAPALIGKLGFDRQLTPKLRVRLTGSTYRNAKSPGNTLYAGDRSGSRYFYVLENTQAVSTSQFRSGRLNPGFGYRVTANQINPFLKYGGLEVFGVIEQASGRNKNEAADRTWRQYATDVVYRFLADEKAYIGLRLNKATGQLAGITGNVGANRIAVGGGMFLTPNVLMKGEYVVQKMLNFPTDNINHGGKFNGLVLEAVIAF